MKLLRRLKRGETSTALITLVGDDVVWLRLWSRVGTTKRAIAGYPAGTHGRLHLWLVIDRRAGTVRTEWGSGCISITSSSPAQP